MGAGLPGWEGLIRNLLEDGFRSQITRGAIAHDFDALELTKLTMERSGLLGASTIARLLHGEQLVQAIGPALYPGLQQQPAAGRIIGSIALSSIVSAEPIVTEPSLAT